MVKVKKIITAILVSLLVIVLMLALLFKLFGNQLIKAGIIAGSQKAFQVDTRLHKIDLKLIGGTVNLQGLEIDNPEGYKHPTFLQLGHAYMDLDMSTLMSHTVEMEKIQLEDINLVIEQKDLTTNNLKEILNNLPKSEPDESESKPAEEKTGKNFRIKVLEINNVKVTAKLIPGIPGRASEVTLPPINIRLENVGQNEKIDMVGLTKKIITEISKGVAEKGKDLLPTDMIGSITDELSKQGQQLLKSGQEAGQKLLEGTKDIGKDAAETLKGLGDILKKKEE